MKTLELFCGTKSFSKVMEKAGHSTYTVDNDPSFQPDECLDVLDFAPKEKYDVLWASPPCETFSVASIGTHWAGGVPKTDAAMFGLRILDRTIWLISEIKPMFWCIENPRGMMRKVIEPIFRRYGVVPRRRITLTYCQYGDTRMKPTDIWTNIQGWEGRRCKNGDRCHEAAPRGSKTGTQGLKNAKDRGVIPPAVFEEILENLNWCWLTQTLK